MVSEPVYLVITAFPASSIRYSKLLSLETGISGNGVPSETNAV